MHRVLSVIPASIDEKSTVLFEKVGKRFLCEYTFEALDGLEAVLATNSQHLADAAAAFSIKTPFLRKENTYGGSMVEAVCDFVESYERDLQQTWDYILIVSPHYPFRPPGFLEHFLQAAFDLGVDSAFAAALERHPLWTLDSYGQPVLVTTSGDLSRSEKKPCFRELSGLAALVRRDVLAKKTLYGDCLGIIPIKSHLASICVKTPEDLDFINTFGRDRLYEFS